jgi:hypothetical protein
MTAVPDSKALRSAAFILHEAQALGIRIGTNGDDLILVAPLKVPRDVRRWFEKKLDEFRAEIISIIQRENADAAIHEFVDAQDEVM